MAKIKKTEKKTRQKKITHKQMKMIHLFCSYSDDSDTSKYTAFIEAGYIGSKNKILATFKIPHIADAIKDYNEKHNVIENTTGRLNEKITQQLEECFRIGLSINKACDCCSLTRSTYHDWIKKGKEKMDEGEINHHFALFCYRMKKAQAEGPLFLVRNIIKSANIDCTPEITELKDKEGNIITTTTKTKSIDSKPLISLLNNIHLRAFLEQPDDELSQEEIEARLADAAMMLTTTIRPRIKDETGGFYTEDEKIKLKIVK